MQELVIGGFPVGNCLYEGVTCCPDTKGFVHCGCDDGYGVVNNASDAQCHDLKLRFPIVQSCFAVVDGGYECSDFLIYDVKPSPLWNCRDEVIPASILGSNNDKTVHYCSSGPTLSCSDYNPLYHDYLCGNQDFFGPLHKHCCVCGGGAKECVLCPSGTTSPWFQDACTPCPVGTIQTPHSLHCEPCPAGTFNPAVGATSCSACPESAYSDSESSPACTPCRPGSYSPQASTSELDCTCLEGYEYVNSTGCSPCQRGFFKNAEGFQQCQECPINTYSAIEGAAACTPCFPGSSSPSGSTDVANCTCAPGFEYSPAAEACSPCPAGYSKQGYGTNPCQGCPPGSYSDQQAASSCQQCPTNATSPNASTDPSQCKCPPGFGAALNSTNPGVITSCSICAAGSASPGDHAPCSPCPSGSYSTHDGASHCTECLAGATNPAGSTDPATCLCPPGFGFHPLNQSCSICSVGQYSTGRGLNPCVSCPNGTGVKQDVVGAQSPAEACEYCPEGNYLKQIGSLSVCTPCESGTFSDVPSATACSACPKDFLGTDPGARFEYQCQCAKGYYSNPPYGPGSNLSNASETECFPCPQGTYKTLVANAPASDCLECPSNFYSDTLAAPSLASCQACPAEAETSGPGQTSREACVCNPGYFSVLIPNTSSPQSCEACEAGKYKAFPGNTPLGINGMCINCPEGTFSTFTAATSDAVCRACGPNTWSPPGSPSATLCMCTPGFYRQRSNWTCMPCPIATYKDGYGNDFQCSPCPQGTFAKSLIYTGGPYNRPPDSYFVRDAVNKSCEPCPQGTITTSTGALSCNPCPQNQTTFAAGYTYCNCSEGFALAPSGNSSDPPACSPCPPNTFKDYIGSGSGPANQCEPCSPLTCAQGLYTSECGGSSPGTCSVCSNCPAQLWRENCTGLNPGRCTNCTPCLEPGTHRTQCGWTDPGYCTGCLNCSLPWQRRVGCAGISEGACEDCPPCSTPDHYRPVCYNGSETDCIPCPVCPLLYTRKNCSGRYEGYCSRTSYATIASFLLPLTRPEFVDQVVQNFLSSLATLLGVSPSNLKVEAVTEVQQDATGATRRRLLQVTFIQVDVSINIQTRDETTASIIAQQLQDPTFNDQYNKILASISFPSTVTTLTQSITIKQSEEVLYGTNFDPLNETFGIRYSSLYNATEAQLRALSASTLDYQPQDYFIIATFFFVVTAFLILFFVEFTCRRGKTRVGRWFIESIRALGESRAIGALPNSSIRGRTFFKNDDCRRKTLPDHDYKLLKTVKETRFLVDDDSK